MSKAKRKGQWNRIRVGDGVSQSRAYRADVQSGFGENIVPPLFRGPRGEKRSTLCRELSARFTGRIFVWEAKAYE